MDRVTRGALRRVMGTMTPASPRAGFVWCKVIGRDRSDYASIAQVLLKRPYVRSASHKAQTAPANQTPQYLHETATS